MESSIHQLASQRSDQNDYGNVEEYHVYDYDDDDSVPSLEWKVSTTTTTTTTESHFIRYSK
jgi:hypothetical protein